MRELCSSYETAGVRRSLLSKTVWSVSALTDLLGMDQQNKSAVGDWYGDVRASAKAWNELCMRLWERLNTQAIHRCVYRILFGVCVDAWKETGCSSPDWSIACWRSSDPVVARGDGWGRCPLGWSNHPLNGKHRTGTNYCFSVHMSFRPNLCIFHFDLTKKPFALTTNIFAGLDFTAAHTCESGCRSVCSMVQIWLKIQHFVRKIMLIINRDSY